MTVTVPFDDFGGDGPLLHFGHAVGYPPACYRRLLERLTERHHVIAVRHRPLWPDSRPEEIDKWHDIADDMIRFFQEQELRGVVGVGHSLGAVTTMIAAIKKPELFKSLVFIEPVFLMPAILQTFAENADTIDRESFPLVKITRSRRNSWGSRQEAFEHFRRKRVFARWSDQALWDYVWHGLDRNETGDLRLAISPGWEARIYVSVPTDVWDLLPQVSHPTLGLRGGETEALAPAAWELWRMIQPGASFVEFADSGHLLPMEQPEEVARAITGFLTKQEHTEA